MGFIGSAAYTSKWFVGFGYRHKKTHLIPFMMGIKVQTNIYKEER
jgi:hypothetical protein